MHLSVEGPFGCFHLSAIVHNDTLHGASQEALVVKNPPANAGDIRDTCSTPGSGKTPWRRAQQPTPVFFAWRIPWTREPGGLQSMGSQKVGHDLATKQEQIIAADISLGVYVDSNVVGWYFQPPPL